MGEGWRPRNETEHDQQQEAAVAEACRAAWGWHRVVKLSEMLYGVDFAGGYEDGTLAGWLEVKCRKSAYADMLLSLAKAQKLWSCHCVSGAPAHFVLSVPDGIYAHHIRSPNSYQIRLGGNSRGQNGDIEPCIYVPFGAFSLVAPPLHG